MKPVLRKPRATARRRAVFALLAAAILAGGYHSFWRYHIKRFQEVRPGVFYRVAQPTEFGLRHLVRQHGVKTVLSVQLFDVRLHQGLFDPGQPSGRKESEYVDELGVRHLQWPMGEEAYWPWLTPWQFEEFFKLLDDPANLPVAVHCMGGRHRTGTLSALFRLEYDRWPIDRALEEMYAFDFGLPVRLQEHNLRTYLPRPHPSAAQWESLRRYWEPRLPGPAAGHYEELVRRLRQLRGEAAIEAALGAYLEGRPFALPLARRLIDSSVDPLAPKAVDLAGKCLRRDSAGGAAWAAAAALTADLGSRSQQQELLDLLADASFQEASMARFDWLVAGVTDRYTPNRIAYLRPLLDNPSHHLSEAARQYRYCDTAVSRLSVITDQNLLWSTSVPGPRTWDHGREAALAWFDAHPSELKPGPLRPATGRTVVRAGESPLEEDLSKLGK